MPARGISKFKLNKDHPHQGAIAQELGVARHWEIDTFLRSHGGGPQGNSAIRNDE